MSFACFILWCLDDVIWFIVLIWFKVVPFFTISQQCCTNARFKLKFNFPLPIQKFVSFRMPNDSSCSPVLCKTRWSLSVYICPHSVTHQSASQSTFKHLLTICRVITNVVQLCLCSHLSRWTENHFICHLREEKGHGRSGLLISWCLCSFSLWLNLKIVFPSEIHCYRCNV